MKVSLFFFCNNIIIVATMYIDTSHITRGGKTYTRHLLCESYRANGKVLHRTIANVSHCSAAEIEAMRLALRHKEDLEHLGTVQDAVTLKQGVSFGAVWTVYHVARKLGIEQVLGTTREGKLALGQVIARVIDQGSRLSAVRLAMSHAACDVLGLGTFDEDALYENLDWLAGAQASVEDRLFAQRQKTKPASLFLYDVTRSYLEGTHNALAAFGYNRDGKKGKPQIVIGLLCDEDGHPLSIEVFPGNTQDPRTVASQTAKQNHYLTDHPRAHAQGALQKLVARAEKLRIADWVKLTVAERALTLTIKEDAQTEAAKLDGCSVLKTDLTPAQAPKEMVHDRYKDLASVEQAFRACKTVHLEVRPIFLRREARTRAHAFVVMLAYQIIRSLASCWTAFDVTVAEGLHALTTLCLVEVAPKNAPSYHCIPTPRDAIARLLHSADITLPKAFALSGTRVSTKKKLQSERLVQ